jgi:2-polyprenyl-3-methyl-5-hydroxy-6-metoxy-1,4-benzoquinol methylase
MDSKPMIKLFELLRSKRDPKEHWENVYQKEAPEELSWYQDNPEMSLKLIAATGVGFDGNIIDIGGGASKLAGLLVVQDHKKVTVLDIASRSIEEAKLALGEQSNRIKWIEADVTNYNFAEEYDLWHDRAVFHFLTDRPDRKRYVDAVQQSLKASGHLIIATFGLKGPRKCSGLHVVRYSPETLHKEFGNNFDLVETSVEVHSTPSKVQQKFIYCHFTKRS